ncbi:phosphotransferase family protein [Pacificimonas sp. ICDLI1SI03]
MEPDSKVLDRSKLATWLDRHAPQLGDGDVEAEVLTGGATNIVLRINRGEGDIVLRRPPLAPRPDSFKVLAREARVLSALNGSPVRTPEMIAYSDERDVLGVPFYLMEYVEGWLAMEPDKFPPAFDDPQTRRGLALELVSGIAELSKVDYRAVGLEDFGKPDGFIERQVDRWLHQHATYADSENYKYRPLPGKDEVVDWLRRNTPENYGIGIIHGDYGYPNALFAPEAPARLAAMIDWELSTIGAPLLDLGWLMYAVPSEKSAVRPPELYQDPAYPLREELVDHYAAVSGQPVRHLTYYMVLAQFKLAMLLERHYARGLNGRLDREMGENMGALALDLLRSAREMTIEADGLTKGNAHG